MATFVVRVLLPDRPGALGAVASRIGSVRGDVMAVEIVERSGTRAVDEFVVELPDEDVVPLLVSQIEEVDGVEVDDVHPALDGHRDRRLDAYDGALSLLRERTPERILLVLARMVRRELDAAWVAVVDPSDRTIVASDGRSPAAQWLANFAHEARVDDAAQPGDVTSVDVAAWDLVLVAGRPGWSISQREKGRLAALARLADARWADVADRDARSPHPSRAI